MNKTPPTRSNVLVLKQILNLIPRGMINRLALETGVDTKARTFSVVSHLSAMLFAQLSHAMGLNDVCDWLRLKSGVLARFGVTQSFRNALSHAYKERSAEFAEKIFWSLLGHLQHASPDFATGRKGKGLLRRFKVRVHAVDQMRYGGRKSNNSLTKATNPFSRMPGIVSSSGRPISLSGRQPNYAICSNTISNPCGPWPSEAVLKFSNV